MILIETKCKNFVNPTEISSIVRKKKRNHLFGLMHDLNYEGIISKEFVDAVEFIDADYYCGFDIIITTKQGEKFTMDTCYIERCEAKAKEILLEIQAFYEKHPLGDIPFNADCIVSYMNNGFDSSNIIKAYSASKKHLALKSYVNSTIRREFEDDTASLNLLNKISKEILEAAK